MHDSGDVCNPLADVLHESVAAEKLACNFTHRTAHGDAVEGSDASIGKFA